MDRIRSRRVLLAADFPVHVLPGYEAAGGGHHATWLPPLARELESACADGWEFHWVTMTKRVTSAVSVAAWGQQFHLLPRRKLALEMFSGFRRERAMISRLAREVGCDLYHGWGTEQGYGLGAIDFQGKSLLSMQGILQRYCQAAPMPWLVRLQARHEARVLGVISELTVESPWGMEQLRRLAPQARVHLLEYGVHDTCFEVVRTPENRPLALFVGSPNHLKGIDTLLAAFADPRLASCQLVVLGDAHASLRAKASGNVIFAGHVAPEEVRAWMARAWCLVHPTRADTSPNCVKEARVIGLPVITTPEGGQSQYVEHGRSGWIHAPGDVGGLVDGVLAVTRDSQTALTMGRQGQEDCQRRLRASHTAAGMLDVYRKLLT